MAFLIRFLLPFLVLAGLTFAINLNIDETQSIIDAASLAANGLQALYNGNEPGGVIGKFPYPPYYWWESGAAWGGMINYWHYTGDDTFNNVTWEALSSQIGPEADWVVPVEAFNEGNDDQAFWVFAALTAAEHGFPDPPPPYPSWLVTAQNAWELYVQRWNTTNCNGGLKWQFHPENKGFYYKQSIANGGFFQISARLARYTGNNTYLEWAEKIWDWTTGIGLIDDIYNVFDGSDELINCSGIDHHQWTYNVGVFLYGAAVLQNYTNGSDVWWTRTNGLLDATSTFFSPFPNASDVMFEAQCELNDSCNVDQLSKKAYLARWLAGTSIMAPGTAGRIGGMLRASAAGAAAACTGGEDGHTCGFKWYTGGYDGNTGVGQQLSAMEVMYSLLANGTAPPKTLPNVIIRDEPGNLTASPTGDPVSPSGSPRPLHDGQPATIGTVPGLALLFTLTLLSTIWSPRIF